MHHVAEPLDGEALGHLYRADLRNAADIVAAEIQQHQMFCPFLWIAEQISFQRPVFLNRLAAPARAGQRANGHGIIAQPHQDFR